MLFFSLRQCKEFANQCSSKLCLLSKTYICQTSCRQGSGSAYRSMYGGFVKWCMGKVSNSMAIAMTKKQRRLNACFSCSESLSEALLYAERWWERQYCGAACWWSTLEGSCNYYCCDMCLSDLYSTWPTTYSSHCHVASVIAIMNCVVTLLHVPYL